MWRRYFRLRLRLGRRDVQTDVDDELEFHLAMRVADLVAGGMSPGAARAEAERRFGDRRAIGDACLTIDQRRLRRADRQEVITDMRQDLTLAARSLRKSPGFALTALVCIALGVGLTTAVFSAARAILIRPLPFERADELVAVYARNTVWGQGGINISYPDYLSWRDESRSLAGLALWTWDSHTLAGGGGEAERVEGAEVTANLFPLLGVRPLLGRGFAPDDETPGRNGVTLLSYGLWRRRYAGDPSVVGRAVSVDGRPYTVVGVMPPGFRFPERGQMWVPFSVEPSALGRENRYFAGAVGRMRPGTTLEQARADLGAVSARLQQQYPAQNSGWTSDVLTMREDLVGALRRPLLVVLGAVGLVLLVACANVANLMVARGAAREREMAVRAAIGAGRGRLVRQALAESLLLAALGGAAGEALAAFGVQLFGRAFPNDVPYYISLGLDRPALAFALLLSALAAVLCGLAPALRAGRADPMAALREGARGTTAGRARALMRQGPTLVVAEVALSIVLMVGAMLLVRSYANLQGTDLGFTERGVLTFRVSLPVASYQARERVGAYYAALLERLSALPGVEAVGAAQGMPFSGWDVSAGVAAEGSAPPPPGGELVSLYQYVTPGFFRTLGVPLVRGRGLAAADRDTVALVGVINELFARAVFPNEDPIGKRIRIGPAGPDTPWITVVGVVGDYRHYRLPQPMGPAVYLPATAMMPRTMEIAVRTAAPDPLTLVPAVSAAMRALDPDVPAYRVRTLGQAVAATLWRQRLQGQVLGTFAALALLMAAVGLYGVISYAVAQRTRELGVRMALGAGRGHVLALVLGQGARLALAGTAAGLVAALALSRVVASLLYGVRPTDPATFVGVPAALAAVALLACYGPARRAARVDPMVAMRGDG